jgi:hypothetical protein
VLLRGVSKSQRLLHLDSKTSKWEDQQFPGCASVHVGDSKHVFVLTKTGGQLFRLMENDPAYSCHVKPWKLVAEHVTQCDAAADGTVVAVQKPPKVAAAASAGAAAAFNVTPAAEKGAVVVVSVSQNVHSALSPQSSPVNSAAAAEVNLTGKTNGIEFQWAYAMPP